MFRQNSASRLRSPRVLRQTPIDAFQQIAQLRRRECHCSIGIVLRERRRPHKVATLQSLRKQTHALSIVPNHFYQSATPSKKNKEMSTVRITLERLLHQKRQAVETTAHIRVAGRQPDLCAARHRDHCPIPSSASARAHARDGVTPSGTRSIRPLRSTTSSLASAIAPSAVSHATTDT